MRAIKEFLGKWITLQAAYCLLPILLFAHYSLTYYGKIPTDIYFSISKLVVLSLDLY